MPWRQHQNASGRPPADAGCRRRHRRQPGVRRWPARWPAGSRGGCPRSCRWRNLERRDRAGVAGRSLALSVQLGGRSEPQVVKGGGRRGHRWVARKDTACSPSSILPAMSAERLMATEESQDLIDLTRQICADQLAPIVSAAEEAAQFPRDTFALLGRSGLLSLPYAEEHGGGGQPYEVYLQVVEEIASVWMCVAVGVCVHSLTCFPVAEYGSDRQRADLLPNAQRPDPWTSSSAKPSASSRDCRSCSPT